MNIIEMKGIYKKSKETDILKDVNFSIKKGKIYGVIGPNGAGKTSTFRILAGLSKKTTGDVIYYEGKMEEKEARNKMSFMIENPYLEMEMTALQNMKLVGILYGVSDVKKIEETLKLVELENTGKKKVKNFSLGMRQRLGIAIALLKSPELIVLDEPMNGLDPEGIVEMRKLLQQLNYDLKNLLRKLQ